MTKPIFLLRYHTSDRGFTAQMNGHNNCDYRIMQHKATPKQCGNAQALAGEARHGKPSEYMGSTMMHPKCSPASIFAATFRASSTGIRWLALPAGNFFVDIAKSFIAFDITKDASSISLVSLQQCLKSPNNCLTRLATSFPNSYLVPEQLVNIEHVLTGQKIA